MKSPHRLTLTGAFALAVVLSTSFAMMAARPQDKPASKAPAAAPPAAKDKPAAPPEGMPPMPPPPGEHHKWLEKLVGNWTIDSEMTPGEGMAPMKATGTDSVRSFGDGRWIICNTKFDMPGMGTMNAIMSLGYNSETGKYQGTWIDSMTDHMWVYVGTLDAAKKTLTLEAEGPNMKDPTSKEKMKYHDVIEFKSDDHRTLTSSYYEDGKWVEIVTANYRRAN